MARRRVWTAMVAGVLIGGIPAVAKSSGPTLQDRQQAACYNDVQKFCGQFVPDVAKTEDCMRDKRPLVSKKCSDMWDVTK